MPLAAPLLIAFFIGQYWIDKCTIFKRSSKSINFNLQLKECVFRVFESSVLFFAVGTIIWELTVHLDAPAWSRVITIMNVVLALCYFLFSILVSEKKKGSFLSQELK